VLSFYTVCYERSLTANLIVWAVLKLCIYDMTEPRVVTMWVLLSV